MTDKATAYYAYFLELFPYGITCWMCGEEQYSERHHSHGRSETPIRVELKGKEVWVVAYKLINALCSRCHRIAGRNLTIFRPGLAQMAVKRNPQLLTEE